MTTPTPKPKTEPIKVEMPDVPELNPQDIAQCARVLVMGLIGNKQVKTIADFKNFILSGYLFGNFKVTVEKETPEQKIWLIWSNEHAGWWKPNERGYTKERSSAGRYTFTQACSIVGGANISKNDVPNEAMIRYE